MYTTLCCVDLCSCVLALVTARISILKQERRPNEDQELLQHLKKREKYSQFRVAPFSQTIFKSGSTTTEFKVRFRNQKSSKKTNKKIYVAMHFNRTPHVLSYFTFQCVYQIQRKTLPLTNNYLSRKQHTGVRAVVFPFTFWG